MTQNELFILLVFLQHQIFPARYDTGQWCNAGEWGIPGRIFTGLIGRKKVLSSSVTNGTKRPFCGVFVLVFQTMALGEEARQLEGSEVEQRGDTLEVTSPSSLRLPSRACGVASEDECQSRGKSPGEKTEEESFGVLL